MKTKTYDVRLSSLNTNKVSARYTVYETDKSRTLDTQASDSRRYKAIGNGMAQPCADFVLRQIVKFQRVR